MAPSSPNCTNNSSCSPSPTTAAHDPCTEAAMVFLSYEKALLGFIKNRVANTADAEDLSQQVLLKVHRHCETLPNVKNVRAWLYEISRHVVTDFYRKEKHTSPLLEETDVVDITEENPFHSLEACILPLLNLIPKKYAEPLRLSDLEGIPQQEIANQLGLSLSGAKSRIQRGREKLKAVFLECCHLELDRKGRLVSAEIRPDCSALQNC
ncbi:RNA polymerase sigma factor SigZ [Nibribacter ruber]|uniref:RNA polymerase sigma factor SigZ n=1 Tax=Nibribacter ruber TaxID=2698458 RepID=A0A6P1P3L0_9BACT|nr:RNA polymerase sigma factor SigZ [Nibribacter ruber]QHL89034.1 RNA polymerase sigma factor SigZ [Nibribacter ruber]